MEAPHNTGFHEWMGNNGKLTPNSSVKGSSANHYHDRDLAPPPPFSLVKGVELVTAYASSFILFARWGLFSVRDNSTLSPPVNR